MKNDEVGEIIFQTYQMLNILFPSIPYIFQIRKFYINESSQGYSKKMSLIIILSSILRIFFWFGKKFHWSLLVQSILVILTQLFVLFFVIKYRNGNKDEIKNPLLQNTNNNFFSFEWDSLLNYFIFLIIFVLVFEIISILLTFDNLIYVESLGTVSSILEAALVFPQIIENCQVKSTANLSKVLVGFWILGDSMKTIYYYVSQAPLQLLISGCVQILLDFFIIFQICIYYKNSPKVLTEETLK